MLPVAAARNRLVVQRCLILNSTSKNSIWIPISMKTKKLKIYCRISIFSSVFVSSGHSVAFLPALDVRWATTSQGPGSRPKCDGSG